MPKRWKEEVLKMRTGGEGILTDCAGLHVPVEYSVRAFQECWERPSINQPTDIGRGTITLSGDVTLMGSAPGFDLGGELLLRTPEGWAYRFFLGHRSGFPLGGTFAAAAVVERPNGFE